MLQWNSLRLSWHSLASPLSTVDCDISIPSIGGAPICQ